MSVIIRLQNLPWSANAADIREFFKGLSVPEGGVHIVGGEMGDAFIAFSTDEDARLAMMKSGEAIKGIQVNLALSSRTQMQKVIEAARQQVNATYTAPPPTQAPAPSQAQVPFGPPLTNTPPVVNVNSVPPMVSGPPPSMLQQISTNSSSQMPGSLQTQGPIPPQSEDPMQSSMPPHPQGPPIPPQVNNIIPSQSHHPVPPPNLRQSHMPQQIQSQSMLHQNQQGPIPPPQNQGQAIPSHNLGPLPHQALSRPDNGQIPGFGQFGPSNQRDGNQSSGFGQFGPPMQNVPPQEMFDNFNNDGKGPDKRPSPIRNQFNAPDNPKSQTNRYGNSENESNNRDRRNDHYRDKKDRERDDRRKRSKSRSRSRSRDRDRRRRYRSRSRSRDRSSRYRNDRRDRDRSERGERDRSSRDKDRDRRDRSDRNRSYRDYKDKSSQERSDPRSQDKNGIPGLGDIPSGLSKSNISFLNSSTEEGPITQSSTSWTNKEDQSVTESNIPVDMELDQQDSNGGDSFKAGQISRFSNPEIPPNKLPDRPSRFSDQPQQSQNQFGDKPPERENRFSDRSMEMPSQFAGESNEGGPNRFGDPTAKRPSRFSDHAPEKCSRFSDPPPEIPGQLNNQPKDMTNRFTNQPNEVLNRFSNPPPEIPSRFNEPPPTIHKQFTDQSHETRKISNQFNEPPDRCNRFNDFNDQSSDRPFRNPDEPSVQINRNNFGDTTPSSIGITQNQGENNVDPRNSQNFSQFQNIGPDQSKNIDKKIQFLERSEWNSRSVWNDPRQRNIDQNALQNREDQYHSQRREERFPSQIEDHYPSQRSDNELSAQKREENHPQRNDEFRNRRVYDDDRKVPDFTDRDEGLGGKFRGADNYSRGRGGRFSRDYDRDGRQGFEDRSSTQNRYSDNYRASQRDQRNRGGRDSIEHGAHGRRENSHCVQVSNIPGCVSYREIRSFFTGIMLPSGSVKFLPDGDGNRSDIAVIKFISSKDAYEAFKRRGNLLSTNEVDVKFIEESVYDNHVDVNEGDKKNKANQAKKKTAVPQNQSPVHNKESFYGPCVLVENLPEVSNEQDVAQMFIEGSIENMFLFKNKAHQTASCYIKFKEDKLAKIALEKLQNVTLDNKFLKGTSCLEEEIMKAMRGGNEPENVQYDLLTDCVVIKRGKAEVAHSAIHDFFSDEGIIPENIYYGKTDFNGHCDIYIVFPNVEDAPKAASKSGQILGSSKVVIELISKPVVMNMMGLPFNPLELFEKSKKSKDFSKESDISGPKAFIEQPPHFSEMPQNNQMTRTGNMHPHANSKFAEFSQNDPNSRFTNMPQNNSQLQPSNINNMHGRNSRFSDFSSRNPQSRFSDIPSTSPHASVAQKFNHLQHTEMHGISDRQFDASENKDSISQNHQRNQNMNSHFQESNSAPPSVTPDSFGPPGCVLGLGNVPYTANTEDILHFFRDFPSLTPECIIRRYDEFNRPTADARVAFKSPEDASRALKTLHRQHIFNRPIFLSLTN